GSVVGAYAGDVAYLRKAGGERLGSLGSHRIAFSPMAAARDAILRNALLASTALVGVSIATPVAAQTVTPAGGSGTIVGGGGSTTDQTGS
ncbi:hypothetical protein, partial [Enterococcus faecium]